MIAFDLAEFVQEQLGEDRDAYELLDDIQAMRDVARSDLMVLLRRFADVVRLIDEELIPLAHKVAKRDLSGHAYYQLCAQLDAALRGGLEAEEAPA